MAPTHFDTSPNAFTAVSTTTHSDEDKGAQAPAIDQAVTLERSISNPVAAVDPTTQLHHVSSDADRVASLEKGLEASEKEDPNIVDFNGPDDPEKAVNWPAKRKWSMLALISSMTFITYACDSFLKNAAGADHPVCQTTCIVHVCTRRARCAARLSFHQQYTRLFCCLGLRSRLCNRAYGGRTMLRDLRSSSRLSCRKRPLHHLHCCLRCKQQSEHAHCVSFP